MKKLPRILIAAPKSGSGKTLFTCGFLHFLKESGRQLTSYKCGPDYIDPMFHRKVIGVGGGNLDSYFASKEELLRILSQSESECAVLEGVMGIYDGLGGISRKASCYEVASMTQTPIILLFDLNGMGATAVSLLRGILEDDSEGLIRGIILNRTSRQGYENLEPLLLKMLEKGGFSAKLLGFLPKLSDLHLESRHLGLVMPHELADLQTQLKRMSDTIQEYCDTDALLAIMDEAADLPAIPDTETMEEASNGEPEGPNLQAFSDSLYAAKDLVLAVAQDEAFCFYYEENLELFRQRGVRIVEFSPLHDENVPEEADAILLGGGYPELHLQELSQNESMKASLAKMYAEGIPMLAECGGFMYLHESITGEDGLKYPMLGVIPGKMEKQEKLVRFGYMEIASTVNANDPMHLLGLKGHEFHYYDSSNNGSAAIAKKPTGNKSWSCLHVEEGRVLGFPHFYYPSRPDFVDHFITCMRKWRIH